MSMAAAVLHRSATVGNARLVMVALAVDVDPITGQTGTDLDRIARHAGCHRSSVGRAIRAVVALGELEPHPLGGWRLTLPTVMDAEPLPPRVHYVWGLGQPPDPAA